MFIKLKSSRKIQGKNIKAGQVVEVGLDLGNKLILGGFAAQTSEKPKQKNHQNQNRKTG